MNAVGLELLHQVTDMAGLDRAVCTVGLIPDGIYAVKLQVQSAKAELLCLLMKTLMLIEKRILLFSI